MDAEAEGIGRGLEGVRLGTRGADVMRDAGNADPAAGCWVIRAAMEVGLGH